MTMMDNEALINKTGFSPLVSISPRAKKKWFDFNHMQVFPLLTPQGLWVSGRSESGRVLFFKGLLLVC